jgi:ASC-1-like (ASCH) protein
MGDKMTTFAEGFRHEGPVFQGFIRQNMSLKAPLEEWELLEDPEKSPKLMIILQETVGNIKKARARRSFPQEHRVYDQNLATYRKIIEEAGIELDWDVEVEIPRKGVRAGVQASTEVETGGKSMPEVQVSAGDLSDIEEGRKTFDIVIKFASLSGLEPGNKIKYKSTLGKTIEVEVVRADFYLALDRALEAERLNMNRYSSRGALSARADAKRILKSAYVREHGLVAFDFKVAGRG